jgi:hypothetical protein
MGTMATSKQLAQATHAKSPAMRRVCPSPEVLKTPARWMSWERVRMKQMVRFCHEMKHLDGKARGFNDKYPFRQSPMPARMTCTGVNNDRGELS